MQSNRYKAMYRRLVDTHILRQQIQHGVLELGPYITLTNTSFIHYLTQSKSVRSHRWAVLENNKQVKVKGLQTYSTCFNL